MNKTQGIEIAEQLRNRGFTLSGWARANRFKLRTVNDFLCTPGWPAWRRTMRRPAFPAIPRFGNNFTDGSLFPGRPPPVIFPAAWTAAGFRPGKPPQTPILIIWEKTPYKSLPHTKPCTFFCAIRS
jgi:hypothetical protein